MYGHPTPHSLTLRGYANQDFDNRFDGLSMNTSKQSMITLVLSPNESIEHLGIVLCSCSLSGQEINGDNVTSTTVNQLTMILETTVLDTLIKAICKVLMWYSET